MANTTNPTFYTAALPSVTNDLKYVIYKTSDFPAEYQSQTFAAPHPDRTVMFPGVAQANYIFKLLEMSGVTVVRQRAKFDIVPSDNRNFEYKAPIEIQVDLTIGLTNGTTTFTFDGTGGKYDWRGFEIFTERVGQGTMLKGTQYTWNKTTGVFTLIEVGITFQPGELFNVEFEILIGTDGGGVPAQNLFTDTLVVTGTTVLTAADIGKNIIIKGASNFFEITLPDIATVNSELMTYFEGGIGNHKCVRIKVGATGTIDYGAGARLDMKIGICENFGIYREPGGTTRWRIFQPVGNFLKVGRIITTDEAVAGEFNCVELDGSALSTTSYARLYEDHVLKLSALGLTCTFATWGTGNNKYKFSDASGGVFHVPDRRSVYDANWDGGVNVPGTFQAAQVGEYTDVEGAHGTGGSTGDTYQGGPFSFKVSLKLAGTKTRPDTVIIRKFILT